MSLQHKTLRRIDIRHNHLSSANRPVASRKGSHQTTVADAISMLLRDAPRLVDLDRWDVEYCNIINTSNIKFIFWITG